jgi:hypothetical protein
MIRHNLPVFIQQIGFRKLKIDDAIREEVALMRVARHPKLVEFVGVCIEPNATYIVEGMFILFTFIYHHFF